MKIDNRIEEVTISSLVYGGDGLARLSDEKAIFIPLCLPGEKVKVRVIEEKNGYARGYPLEYLTKSADRIDPLCKYFGVCGGCHYQILRYEQQLIEKQKIFTEQLERIGGFKNINILPISASPEEWGYRNSLQFSISGDGRKGFQRMGSNEIVVVEECLLAHPEINNLWKQFDFETVPGINRVVIRRGMNDELLMVIEGEDEIPPEFEVDIPISAVYASPYGKVVLAGDNYLNMDVMEKGFYVSGGSFFQVNNLVAGKMVEYILNKLRLSSDMTVMDIYSGVGLFSAFIAPSVRELIGIELSPEACQDYIYNLDEYDNIELFEGSAEIILPDLNKKADTIIIDPPRTGLDRKAVDAILSMSPKTITYVSCDPTTLARDAKRLCAGGYVINEIQPFDMFPQTYHIESITIFTLVA
jgi:23S rRNA (uracil1939-C5)-methyltransferase